MEVHKSATPWKRLAERVEELSEEEKATQDLYRKLQVGYYFDGATGKIKCQCNTILYSYPCPLAPSLLWHPQGILNKLTPQKFQTLAEQALRLDICSEERLRGVVDKIFTKVTFVTFGRYVYMYAAYDPILLICTPTHAHTHIITHTHTHIHAHAFTHSHSHTHNPLRYPIHCHQALEEPNYSVVYANLCKVLSPVKVDWTATDGKPRSTNFRRVVLTKCQKEFEKGKKDDDNRQQMLKAIEEADTVRRLRERGVRMTL